jgi:phage-related protein
MPPDIQDQIGTALSAAQSGGKATNAKPLRGGDLAYVMEIVVDDHSRTFRGAYTTKFADIVYVLDVFVKKSKVGTETPKMDEDRIRARYRLAKEHHEANYREKSR